MYLDSIINGVLIVLVPLLFVFICKLSDCALNTLKSLMLNKDRYFIAAVLASFSNLFFIFTAKQEGVAAYVVIWLATFLGTYLPARALSKMEKDKLYVYEITSTSIETGAAFASTIRDLDIPISTTKGRNTDGERVLVCKVYSSNKATSLIVDSLIPEDFKLNITTPIIVR